MKLKILSKQGLAVLLSAALAMGSFAVSASGLELTFSDADVVGASAPGGSSVPGDRTSVV